MPHLKFPCEVIQLVADRLRQRIFVHGFAGSTLGHVGVIDETLTYRPLVVGPWVGTAFAYAPDADQFFVTRLGTFEDPMIQVVAFSGSTGEELTAFAVPNVKNTRRYSIGRDIRRSTCVSEWRRSSKKRTNPIVRRCHRTASRRVCSTSFVWVQSESLRAR